MISGERRSPLRRGLYTFASFSGQSEICTVKLCLTAAIPAVCQFGATKSACPAAAKKRLPPALPHRRDYAVIPFSASAEAKV